MSMIEEAIRKAKLKVAQREPEVRAAPAVVESFDAGAPRELNQQQHAMLETRRSISLDRDALRQAGLLPHPDDERRIKSEYRAIKRGLLASFARGDDLGDRGIETVAMVTSAAPGEGKSFTSMNLALGLAEELDWLVILVDADVSKQHLTAVLGLQGESGLLDALSDTQASLADVVHRTSSPKLMFVPAGRQSAESNELLSSSRMQFLLEQLARDFPRSIVLLDSPPLLDTNEARALIDVAGQVLLVVRADVTPRALVQQAVEVLGADRPVSLILNGAQRSSVGSYYYYGEQAEHAAARSS